MQPRKMLCVILFAVIADESMTKQLFTISPFLPEHSFMLKSYETQSTLPGASPLGISWSVGPSFPSLGPTLPTLQECNRNYKFKCNIDQNSEGGVTDALNQHHKYNIDCCINFTVPHLHDTCEPGQPDIRDRAGALSMLNNLNFKHIKIVYIPRISENNIHYSFNVSFGNERKLNRLLQIRQTDSIVGFKFFRKSKKQETHYFILYDAF